MKTGNGLVQKFVRAKVGGKKVFDFRHE